MMIKNRPNIPHVEATCYFISISSVENYTYWWPHPLDKSRIEAIFRGWGRHASIESVLGGRVYLFTRVSQSERNIQGLMAISRRVLERAAAEPRVAEWSPGEHVRVTCASKLEQTWISLEVEDARSIILVARNCVYKGVRQE